MHLEISVAVKGFSRCNWAVDGRRSVFSRLVPRTAARGRRTCKKSVHPNIRHAIASVSRFEVPPGMCSPLRCHRRGDGAGRYCRRVDCRLHPLFMCQIHPRGVPSCDSICPSGSATTRICPQVIHGTAASSSHRQGGGSPRPARHAPP